MSSNGRAWRLMRLLKLKTPLGFPGNCGCWEGITTGRRVVFNLRIPPFKISEDEFKLNYSLQSVIFIAWRRVIDPHGLKGLVLAYQVYQQCQLNHSLDCRSFHRACSSTNSTGKIVTDLTTLAPSQTQHLCTGEQELKQSFIQSTATLLLRRWETCTLTSPYTCKDTHTFMRNYVNEEQTVRKYWF